MMSMDTAPHDGSTICLYQSYGSPSIGLSALAAWRSVDSERFGGFTKMTGSNFWWFVSGGSSDGDLIVAERYDGWDRPEVCATKPPTS